MEKSGNPGLSGRETLNATLRRLATRYTEAAQEILGDNLVSIVLFGSVARGEAGPSSDIDLLVVCRRLPRGAFRRREVLDSIRARFQDELDRLWTEGVFVDFVEVVKTREEAQRMHRLYLDMTEEAVLLFDREDFFAGVLEKMRQRLGELGARRRQMGAIRYWDLKPDFQPGDVIEL